MMANPPATRRSAISRSMASRSALAASTLSAASPPRSGRPHSSRTPLRSGGPPSLERALLQLSHGGPPMMALTVPSRHHVLHCATRAGSVKSQTSPKRMSADSASRGSCRRAASASSAC